MDKKTIFSDGKFYEIAELTDKPSTDFIQVELEHFKSLTKRIDAYRSEILSLREHNKKLLAKLDQVRELSVFDSRLTGIENVLSDLHSQYDLRGVISVLGKEKE